MMDGVLLEDGTRTVTSWSKDISASFQKLGYTLEHWHFGEYVLEEQ